MIIVVYEKSNDVLNQTSLTAGTRETFIPDIQGSVLATLDSGSGVLRKARLRFGGETTGSAADLDGPYYDRASSVESNPWPIMPGLPICPKVPENEVALIAKKIYWGSMPWNEFADEW